MLEQLAQMFGIGGGVAPAAPKAPTYSPEIQAILDQAGYAPEDPAQAKRRAIAQGLASFGKAMATSTQDFLPALGAALPTGAESYLKAREGQEDDRRKAAIDLMKQVFGFDKAQDLNAYRLGSLDERKRHNLETEGQGDQRLVQGDRRLEQGDRRLEQGDRRLEQGDTRLNQNQQKIDNTETWRSTQDENTDDRTAIMQRRLEDAYGQNEERLRQGRERLAMQQEAGRRDAQRLKAQLDSGYYSKGAKGDIGSTKQRNQELDTRAKILRVISEKAKSLGLNDPALEFREPETWKAGKLELEEYAKSIYAEFGYDERGMPLPDRAQPVPVPNEAQSGQVVPKTTPPAQSTAQSGGSTTGMGSRAEPVTGITSREQFDALPSGAWYINPADGKTYRKK